ncbi:PAS domain S-box-containing protein [Paucidesulfovibrio gracilis DSM 16080]|uniref:histidine kinase n=1 Tax=Paucidesulfovibrio gracilis DSM 16080 TaxID=1121449 RepID=A0A1T4Y093_9BACT|nr:PAS domain S-box protein [Paucidesulfovibrio gracilis]SKA94685.1 PAS domain S-box-containing protein [Paucidesulfovibrio gracilis DSM 16080]
MKKGNQDSREQSNEPAVNWRQELEGLLSDVDPSTAGAVRDLFERHAESRAESSGIPSLESDGRDIYSTFFSLAGDSILLHTLEGCIMDANKMACARLGYSRDQLRDRSFHDVLSKGAGTRLETALARVESRGRYSFETTFLSKSGAQLPVEVSARIVNHGDQDMVLSIARDISARKVAEEIVLEQKVFLSQIIRNLPVGLFVKKVRNEMRYTLWNRMMEEMTGIPRERAIGKCDRDIFGTELQRWRGDSDHIVVDKHETVELCMRNLDAEGEEIIYQVVKVPIMDAEGNTDSVLGIVEDITDRVRADAEIRRAHDDLERRVEQRTAELLGVNERLGIAEEKFRSIFENSILGIFRTDLEGRLLVCNPALAQMFGYENTVDIIQASEDNPEAMHRDRMVRRDKLEALLRGEHLEPFEHTYTRKDGSSFVGRTHVRLLRDRRDNFPYLEGFVEDISESREAQERLQRSERDYRTLYEQASEAIFLLSTDGRILDANSMATEILGYSLEEFLGMAPQAMITRDHQRIWEQLQDIHQGNMVRLEVNMRTGGGREITADLSARLLEEGRVLVMLRDNTERTAMEAALRTAKEEAEQASQAKSEFLANMSHEIRTPLGGIIGMTDMVLGGELKAQEAEYIKGIKEASRSLLEIINDILDFSKIEARKMEILAQPFQLRERLEIVAGTFRLSAMEKDLDLQVQCPSELEETYVGDACRLGQVLSNLVSNAVKFTDEGTVVMGVELVERRAHSSVLHFSVTDTGIGIPEADLDRLFDVFSQLEPSLNKRHRGTGLGLAISKRLVEMMGGEIRVTSRVGQGSRFSFDLELPHAEGDAREDSPGEDAVTESSRRVLLAEDNELNQEFLTFFLEDAGHTVRVAGNGKEVLQALSEERFDIVLMDIQMPEMDGMEATARIRRGESAAPSDIPIVALTAYAMKGDRERMLEAGMNDYLSKPVDMEALYRIIEELVPEPEA